MRIITGKFKGRTLESLPDLSVRPATDRVKTTIFDMLQNRLRVIDAAVLDLFAGSGNLGFEALSRGAKRIVFVDSNNHVLDIIEKNAEKLDCLSNTIIAQGDALLFAERTTDRFDLIFADPPYAYERIKDIPTVIFQKKILKEEGYLIIEHSKHTIFEPSPDYKLAVQKEFGNTRVSFFVYPNDKGDEQ